MLLLFTSVSRSVVVDVVLATLHRVRMALSDVRRWAASLLFEWSDRVVRVASVAARRGTHCLSGCECWGLDEHLSGHRPF